MVLSQKREVFMPVRCHFIVRRPITTSVARRARQSCVFRHFLTVSHRTGACTCATRMPAALGGHSSHIAPRSCTEGEEPLAGDMPLRSARLNHDQRGTARTRQACVFFHILRDSHRSGACARSTPMPRLHFEVTARTSHHGLAPKERSLWPATCHFVIHDPITTSAARRARGKLACFSTS